MLELYKFKTLKFILILLIFFIFIKQSVIAEEINEAARRLSEQKNMDDYQKIKSEIQHEQLNLNDAMKEAMADVSELTKDDVADRQHTILFDQLGSKYSKDKVLEQTNLNGLIVSWQQSEINLMKSTAKYAETKNELSTMFETRKEVLEGIGFLESDVQNLQKIIIALSEDFNLLTERHEFLVKYVEQIQESTLNESQNQNTEIDNTNIQKILGVDQEVNTSEKSIDLVLSGIKISKGILKASFIGRDDFSKTVMKGDSVKDGWTVVDITNYKVELTDGLQTISFDL